MAKDWRAAYFQQARSDYETMQELGKTSVQFCQRLHYLQMATEKLAKGFGTPPGGQPPPKVHQAYARFVQQVKRRPELQRVCECGPQQIEAHINSLAPIAKRIEDLAPANAGNGPNPEYLWVAGADVIAPAEYPFANLQFDTRSMINMLKFLDRCFQLVEEEE